MERTRFIVHEEFTGKQKPEDVFVAVFLSASVFVKCCRIDGPVFDS